MRHPHLWLLLLPGLAACGDKEEEEGAPEVEDTGSGSTPTRWVDEDGDGYGDPASPIAAPEGEPGTADNADDCDDGDAAVNPGADEVCDENDLDEDCDGLSDEADPSVTGLFDWYPDVDGDGYGDEDATPTQACEAPSGQVEDGTDCDDNDAAIGGGGSEYCDGRDNDCDGSADWGLNVPANHATIAAAIAAAADGDTICVDVGTWAERLKLDKRSLTIQGYGGSAATTINAAGGGAVVTVSNGSTIELAGFTLSKGNYETGAGIGVADSVVVLDDVVIADATCSGRSCYGALHADSSELTLTDLLITGTSCTAKTTDSEDGATCWGVATFEDSTVSWTGGGIEDSLLETSGAGINELFSAGIYAGDSVLELTDLEIANNLSDSTSSGDDTHYGVLSLLGTDATLSSCSIHDNALSSDLGIQSFLYLASSSTVVLQDSQIADNLLSAGGHSTCGIGPLLWLVNSALDLLDSEISGNSSSSSCPDEAQQDYTVRATSCSLTMDGSAWIDNRTDLESTTSSASLTYTWSFQGCTVDFQHSLIADNLVTVTADSGTASSDRGLYLYNSTMSWNNLIYSGNSRVAEGSSSSALYGQLYARKSALTLTNVDIVANELQADSVESGLLYAAETGDFELANSAISWNGATATSVSANLYSSSEDSTSSSLGALSLDYCDLYDNGTATDDFLWADGATATYVGTGGNVAVDPSYVDTSSADTVDWDLTLDSTSAMIDAGDPAILDVDGSRSDMGAYGGPEGAW